MRNCSPQLRVDTPRGTVHAAVWPETSFKNGRFSNQKTHIAWDVLNFWPHRKSTIRIRPEPFDMSFPMLQQGPKSVANLSPFSLCTHDHFQPNLRILGISAFLVSAATSFLDGCCDRQRHTIVCICTCSCFHATWRIAQTFLDDCWI